MGRPRGNFSAGIEVEQLSRHLLDCSTRPVALLRPPLSSQRMKPWRRRITGDVGCGPISLDLIDSIKRYVQPVAALVLDHRRFDGAFPEKDFLNAAIDPDSVLEMDDVITRGERRQALDAGAGHVASRSPNPSLPPKDLMIG